MIDHLSSRCIDAFLYYSLRVLTMAYSATTERVSPEEFLAWEEKQPEKHEFINGEVYAMVGVTRQHATVAGNIFSAIMQHLQGTSCRVYMGDMKLKLVAADAFFIPTCSLLAPNPITRRNDTWQSRA